MKILAKLLILNLLFVLNGCSNNPDDPLEPFNRSMFSFNETLDAYVLEPVAQGYVYVVPSEVRAMVTNFFNNLGEPVHVANELLQFKFTKAVDDAERFVFNTTFGVFGLFDIADETLQLPLRRQTFATTFSYYTSNAPSTYIVWPFLGSSTLRNTTAGITQAIVSMSTNQVDVGGESYRSVNYEIDKFSILSLINTRANLLKYNQLMELQLDPYIAYKQHYLNQQNQLYRKLNES